MTADDQVRQLAVLAGRGAQLGVSVRDLDAEQAKSQSGAVVEDVRAGSAAEKAGIKKGDVIAEFDGERVRGVRHLTRLVTETPDGRTVKAAVMREGKRVDLTVTPDSGTLASTDRNFEVAGAAHALREAAARRGRHDLGDAAHARRGVGLQGAARRTVRVQERKGPAGSDACRNSTGSWPSTSARSTGVLVNSVEADSPAAKAGLKAGDVITAINGKAVAEPSDLIDVVQGVEDGATLTRRLHARQEGAVGQGDAAEKKEPVELPRKRQSARPI